MLLDALLRCGSHRTNLSALEIEGELQKLNLGTEIELGTKWLKAGNSKSEYNDDGELTGVFYPAWTLGYGRNNRGGWSLLVREYRVPQTPSGTDPDPNEIVEEDTTPLLEASRDLRIQAAEQIPNLLEAIEKAVKRKIETLKKVTDKR